MKRERYYWESQDDHPVLWIVLFLGCILFYAVWGMRIATDQDKCTTYTKIHGGHVETYYDHAVVNKTDAWSSTKFKVVMPDGHEVRAEEIKE